MTLTADFGGHTSACHFPAPSYTALHLNGAAPTGRG
jgi:hypothetical protein